RRPRPPRRARLARLRSRPDRLRDRPSGPASRDRAGAGGARTGAVVRAPVAIAVAVALAAAVSGCARADLGPARWHQGEITIGTVPTNGVFNQVGGGYADVINRHMPGYEAVAVPTNGSAEN